MSVVVKTSLSASGTPASGPSGSPARRRSSTAAAAASAASGATCRNARTCSSTALIRSRCARVTSTAEVSPAAMAAASPAAVIRVSSPYVGSGAIGQSSARIRGTRNRPCSAAGAWSSAAAAPIGGTITSSRNTLVIGSA